MSTQFEGVPDWPDAKPAAAVRDARFDNQPPLEERVLLEFDEELQKQGLVARAAQLLESAGRVPEIDSDAIAGKVGDLIKQSRALQKAIEAVREMHNRPILNAKQLLKGKADGTAAELMSAIAGIRQRLDAYVAEQDRIALERQRLADEEAQRIRNEQAKREAEAFELGREAAPAPVIQAAVVEKPVVRGDLGARVGTKTDWKGEIESVRQLPDRILKHAKVLEALQSVVAAEIRGGAREIKGVRIFSEQKASIR